MIYIKNIGNEYSWKGILIVTVLGVVGFLILIFSGCFNILSYNDLYNYVSVHGLEAIFSLFFIGVTIHCWVLFFRNKLINPKKETLYLSTIQKGTCCFIDKKGKRFFFAGDYQVGNFYSVLKTADSITKVLEESNETFKILDEKISYWLNFYSPMGNFENVFLLPIVYVILLPGLLSAIMSESFDKIYGIIWCLFPGLIIIYDLIIKIKLKKTGKKKVSELDSNRLVLSLDAITNALSILPVIIINVILIYLFLLCADNISRLILSPFCLCGLSALGYSIASLTKSEKAMLFFGKSYILIFLIYWFGFLIFFTKEIIKQEGDYYLVLFTIPFWLSGLFVLRKNLLKK